MNLDIIGRRAELTPGRDAVLWRSRWYSYGDMNERAERLAAQLYRLGIGKGDRVSILSPNHLAHLDLILATPKLGFVYTPLNYRLSAAEQQKVVAYLRPSLLFYAETYAETATASGVPCVDLAGYDAWLEPAPVPPAPDLVPEDIQMILLTGGTTGRSKGAMQPYRQGLANAANTVMSWGLREDDCAVQATPCFHAGVNALTVPLLHLGARVVLQETFEPAGYLELLEASGATLMFMVPTMYKLLSEAATFAETDFSKVRWAISGGAPCPEPVRDGFRARSIRFKQGYGLTEAGVNCFAIELADAEARPNSVGKPVLYAEAVIRVEEGTPVAPGKTGELTLRGPHVFSGYFEAAEETAAVLRDGWLWTGDLAKQDEDGFYTIVGRRKELFISGGENVFPVEIENALYEHGAVAECAVLGVPSERWGEVGLAVVVTKTEIGADDLKTFLRTRLASYKVPHHIRFRDTLPKSGAGKVLKAALREDFLENHASR